MGLNSFTATQGTQTPLLTDNTGGTAGTLIAVQKVDISPQGTAGTIWDGNVGVNNGTIGSLLGIRDKVYINSIDNGTVVGKDANAAAQTGNPIAIGGTDSGGTIRTVKVDSGGLQRIGLDSGTVSVLPNIPGGTINVATIAGNLGTIGTIGLATVAGNVGVSSGTINISTISALPNLPGGSIAVTAGTFTGAGGSMISYGPAAAAAAAVGNPLNIGGTDSGGTIRTIKVDSGGLQRIGLDSGTISVLPNLPQGSINVTAGTIGTVTNIGQVYNAGTLATGANTIGNVGTVNVATISAGTVHLAGTVQDSFSGLGTFTITIGTLASSGSVGRQSQIVDNTSNLWPAALIAVKTTAGTVTAAGAINIYLYRSDNGGGPIQDDSTGTADAAATVNNSPLLGVIPINIGTNNQYQAIFDTTFLGHLGPKFGIIVQHALGNPLNATSGSHSITYQSIASKFS